MVPRGALRTRVTSAVGRYRTVPELPEDETLNVNLTSVFVSVCVFLINFKLLSVSVCCFLLSSQNNFNFHILHWGFAFPGFCSSDLLKFSYKTLNDLQTHIVMLRFQITILARINTFEEKVHRRCCPGTPDNTGSNVHFIWEILKHPGETTHTSNCIHFNGKTTEVT